MLHMATIQLRGKKSQWYKPGGGNEDVAGFKAQLLVLRGGAA